MMTHFHRLKRAVVFRVREIWPTPKGQQLLRKLLAVRFDPAFLILSCPLLGHCIGSISVRYWRRLAHGVLCGACHLRKRGFSLRMRGAGERGIVENVIIVTFDVEPQAYEAFSQLKNDSVNSAYTILQMAVLMRDSR